MATHTLNADMLTVGGTGAPAFQNSWTNLAGGYRWCEFWKDPTGHVHLRGVVTGGAASTVVFTLPVGLRPTVREVFIVLAAAGSGRVDVLTDGTVYSFAAGTAGGYVSLSGITFLADA